MEMKFRDRKFLKLEPDRWESYLKSVESSFGQDWLSDESGTNRVQKAWNRTDFLSTIELMTLGHALHVMEKIDGKWVRARVDAIRHDTGKAHGDLFELHCCAMFAAGGMNIAPAPESCPGFDATIYFKDGHKLFVSMKNHDISSRERDFRSDSRAMRETCVRIMSTKRRNAIVAVCANRLPGRSDWQKLDQAIQTIVAEGTNSANVEVAPGIFLQVGDLAPIASLGRLSTQRFSDVFVAICKQYEHEQNNFKRRLDEARLNMREQIKRESDAGYIVMMRLHPTASLDEMEQFGQSLLDENGDPGCDGFWLYQPTVCRQKNNDSTLIHYLRTAGLQKEAIGSRRVNLNTPIGLVSQESPRYELHINNIKMDFGNHYLFQAGDQYYEPRFTEPGMIEMDLKHLASGIFAHYVIPGIEGVAELKRSSQIKTEEGVLSGNFPPDEELTLI